MFYLNITRVNSRNYLSRLSCSRQFTNNQNRKILNLKTFENNPQIRFLSTTMATSSNFKVTDNVKHKHVNRLINEKSPYLLQHAHNPVEWYSWSEESIKLAKEQNKLIFLSIGYSTCHWCHVMEKESFENEETAAIMNKHFINIKVDREERPEIDKLYMTFILLINGSGGWPLSIWLTPDLAPVTGGTYFPPKDRWGMPGFTTILQKIASKWESDKESLTTTGISVIEAIQKSVAQKRADGDSEDMIMSVEDKFQQAIRIYKKNWDRNWGGSLGAPKFPEVSKINLLLHSYVQTKDKELLDIVTNTLDKIANGGIHDHIFGGFARYSVDKKWHVPHFEKMLYDQGQLLIAYVNAYKITNSIRYLEVAEKIFKYVCKDLYHPGGGFYSGEDADSLPEHTSVDKIEGAFYAFAYGEVEELFEENKSKFTEYKTLKPFDIYSYHFDIKEDGNVEPASDPHGHLLEKNILFVNGSLADTAEKFGTTPEIVAAIIDIGHGILHEYREKRPRPHLDTKIICAWNGLMLSGICKAASVDAPNRDEYLKVANKQIEFIRANLYDAKERKLLRACYGDNETTSLAPKPIYGFLDDYTFLIKGLIDHYIASLDVSSLFWAKELQDLQDEYFWDDANGGYFYSQANSPDVIVRMKEDHDGAEPCGNSVAANNLILLGAYYEDLNYKNKAIRLSEYFTNVNPFGYVLPEMMSAFLSDDVGLHMLIVVGPDNEESRKLISVASNYYVPGLISILYKTDKPDDITRQSVKQFKAIKDKPTAYVCHNKRCNLPITCPKALAEEFASIYLCTESDKASLNSQSPLNKK